MYTCSTDEIRLHVCTAFNFGVIIGISVPKRLPAQKLGLNCWRKKTSVYFSELGQLKL